MQNERDDNARMEEFEAVAMPHMKDLFRTAVALLRNRTEAEDVAQEVYLQAWKSFHRFTPGTNCRAWLFQILFHVVSHHRRKWFRWSAMSDDLEVVENTVAYEPPVVQEQISDEQVIAAFRKLPQQFAEVVVLADVHDFSYREIQETLGIPIGTVMSRLNRGRRLLRVELAEMARSAGVRAASQAA
ncbi:MAG: sigma-70 family RNA polymerase sigma factor [Blastocatellia bacterium]